MLKPAQYWRVALSLPLLLGAAWVALFYLTGAQLTPPTPYDGTLAGLALAGAQFFLLTFRLGIWPAYVVWLAVFLWWTWRHDDEHVERAAWFAPLTFSPTLLIAVPMAMVLQEQEYYGGEGVVIFEAILGGIWFTVLALVVGYFLATLAWAFKRACQRLHLVTRAS